MITINMSENWRNKVRKEVIGLAEAQNNLEHISHCQGVTISHQVKVNPASSDEHRFWGSSKVWVYHLNGSGSNTEESLFPCTVRDEMLPGVAACPKMLWENLELSCKHVAQQDLSRIPTPDSRSVLVASENSSSCVFCCFSVSSVPKNIRAAICPHSPGCQEN